MAHVAIGSVKPVSCGGKWTIARDNRGRIRDIYIYIYIVNRLEFVEIVFVVLINLEHLLWAMNGLDFFFFLVSFSFS